MESPAERRRYVVVSGPAASGKTTLARRLADELALVGDLSRLDGRLVEVFCRCDSAIAEARYEALRERRPTGYVSEHRNLAELWTSETTEPVAGGWPVIEVD